MWCKRVGGDRGLIRTYDKRKGQRESNLIWSKSRTEAKRGKKGVVQETVPGREAERGEDRNAVQGCWVVEGEPVARLTALRDLRKPKKFWQHSLAHKAKRHMSRV